VNAEPPLPAPVGPRFARKKYTAEIKATPETSASFTAHELNRTELYKSTQLLRALVGRAHAQSSPDHVDLLRSGWLQTQRTGSS